MIQYRHSGTEQAPYRMVTAKISSVSFRSVRPLAVISIHAKSYEPSPPFASTAWNHIAYIKCHIPFTHTLPTPVLVFQYSVICQPDDRRLTEELVSWWARPGSAGL